MQVTVLDYGFSSVTTICVFRRVGLLTPFTPTLFLKDPQKEDEAIYPELLTVGGIRWNNLPGYGQPKDKVKLPVKN